MDNVIQDQRQMNLDRTYHRHNLFGYEGGGKYPEQFPGSARYFSFIIPPMKLPWDTGNQANPAGQTPSVFTYSCIVDGKWIKQATMATLQPMKTSRDALPHLNLSPRLQQLARRQLGVLFRFWRSAADRLAFDQIHDRTPRLRPDLWAVVVTTENEPYEILEQPEP